MKYAFAQEVGQTFLPPPVDKTEIVHQITTQTWIDKVFDLVRDILLGNPWVAIVFLLVVFGPIWWRSEASNWFTNWFDKKVLKLKGKE